MAVLNVLRRWRCNLLSCSLNTFRKSRCRNPSISNHVYGCWNSRWIVAGMGITGATIGVTAFTNQNRSILDQLSFAFEQYHTSAKDKPFGIKRKDNMPLNRDEERENWQVFVESALEGFAIKWVYGEQGIGKSCILKEIGWNLQQKWEKEGKKLRLFYVNLEGDPRDNETIIRDLTNEMDKTIENGIKPCVIFGMQL